MLFDIKSIAFLKILLAPEVFFVTLHMGWHKGCCSNNIHKNYKPDEHTCMLALMAAIILSFTL